MKQYLDILNRILKDGVKKGTGQELVQLASLAHRAAITLQTDSHF